MTDYTRLDALARALMAEVQSLQGASGRRGPDGSPYVSMSSDAPVAIHFCTWRGEPARVLAYKVGGVIVRITMNEIGEIVLVSIGKVDA